jgi:heme/copper-type cytochrome/quinol oxidase subunit 3
MSDVVQSPPDPLAEPPEVHERNLFIAARIIAGTTIMFFLAFVFAYFYLRSLNNGGHWRPPRVDPPQGYGDTIVVLFALSAASFVYAARSGKRGASWIGAAAAALVLGLAGCIVQVFEYANLGFGPQDGGYASVFMGWTITFVVFVVLAMFWVEIVLAEGIRNRGAAGSSGQLPAPAGLADAAFYWALLATIGVLSWFVLYVL